MSSKDVVSAEIEATIRDYVSRGQPVRGVVVIKEPTPEPGQEQSFVFEIEGGIYGAQSVPKKAWAAERDATTCTCYTLQHFGKAPLVHAVPAQRVRNGVWLE